MTDYHWNEKKEIEIENPDGSKYKRIVCPYCFENCQDKQNDRISQKLDHDCKNVFYVYISKTTGKEISPSFAQEYKRKAISNGINVDKWTIELKSIAQCNCWTKDMHNWRHQEQNQFKSKII